VSRIGDLAAVKRRRVEGQSGLVGKRMEQLMVASGLTTVSWQQDVLDQIANKVEPTITASGGWCAPASPTYDIFPPFDPIDVPHRYEVTTDPWTELFGDDDDDDWLTDWFTARRAELGLPMRTEKR
jgi:hypothetical protein